MVSEARIWKQQAHALFEHQAEHYATLRKEEPSFRAQLDILAQMLNGARGRVLDIGCAAGCEIALLRKLDLQVVGLDISATMLHYAQQCFESDSGVQLCRGDAEFLPFPSESFDHVICMGTLEYLPNYGPALREISRVLIPGGSVVFSIPSRRSLYHVSDRIFERVGARSWRAFKRVVGKKSQAVQAAMPEHSRNPCVPRAFRQLLREFALVPEQSAYSNFTFYPLERLPRNYYSPMARFLEQFSSYRFIGWLGGQYLISAAKKVSGLAILASAFCL